MHGKIAQSAKLLTAPVIENLRMQSDALFSNEFIERNRIVVLKALELSFFFALASLGFQYGYVLLVICMFYHVTKNQMIDTQNTLDIWSASNIKENQKIFEDAFGALPSWVAFPDFESANWINEVMSQMWPFVSARMTFYVKMFIEPELHNILSLYRLDAISGFEIKEVDIGTIPANVEGMKVYKNSSRDSSTKISQEIILDADIHYAGNARVTFSLQGINAMIKDIRFRGKVRIHLKPLLDDFPFFGGFEMYFMKSPTLEYHLGGIGTFAEVPGINQLVRSIVKNILKTRLVWPNKFKLYFPSAEGGSKVKQMMPCPAGLLKVTVKEGRNLVTKDNNILGSGVSDPFVNISIGGRNVSFRHEYMAKSLNPKWNYNTSFIMEDPRGQEVKITVMDYDTLSCDDFMGSTDAVRCNKYGG